MEDRNEPGDGVDRVWIQVRDRNRVVVAALSLPTPAGSGAVEIMGGNIVVPHGPAGHVSVK